MSSPHFYPMILSVCDVISIVLEATQDEEGGEGREGFLLAVGTFLSLPCVMKTVAVLSVWACGFKGHFDLAALMKLHL